MASADEPVDLNPPLGLKGNNSPWAKLINTGVTLDEDEEYFLVVKERHTIGRKSGNV